jgi:hypothetical protein
LLAIWINLEERKEERKKKKNQIKTVIRLIGDGWLAGEEVESQERAWFPRQNRVEERIYQGMSEKTMQRFVDAGGYPL